MACVPGLLGRSTKFSSNYVASLCVAKPIDRLPPNKRLLSQPIQELKVHSGPRTHVPEFNGYLAEFFGRDPLQEIVHEFRYHATNPFRLWPKSWDPVFCGGQVERPRNFDSMRQRKPVL
jgi:hypothetical protein